MERYQRAYRDPNSPLTPLTPLIANVFDFNLDGSTQGAGVAKSPLTAGLEAISSLFQGERGHRLGSASSCSFVCNQGNTPSMRRPIPPKRQKRLAIKSENLDAIPSIKIEPPPRRKRHAYNENYQDSAADEDNLNISDLSENIDFVRQQQAQLEKYKNQKNRRFDASKVRLSSPVPPKPLSPRLGAFLTSWGMNCLKSIFERQEIDMQTFCCLTANDLALLGIEDPEKCELVLKAVDFLKHQLQNE